MPYSSRVGRASSSPLRTIARCRHWVDVQGDSYFGPISSPKKPPFSHRRRSQEFMSCLNKRAANSFLEIRVLLVQIQFLNPNVTESDVMSFRLKFEPLRCVGDAFAVIVDAIHARIRAA